MENRYNKKNRRKYSLKVHIVLVTKYRKLLLSFPNINNDIKTKLIEICKLNNYKIIAIETDLDHVHLLISYDTTVTVSDIVKRLKQETTYYIWQKHYKFLIKKYWKKKVFCVQYRRSFISHNSKIYRKSRLETSSHHLKVVGFRLKYLYEILLVLYLLHLSLFVFQYCNVHLYHLLHVHHK